MCGKVMWSDKPSKKWDKESRTRDQEKEVWKCVSKCINTKADCIQATSQNLRYEIRKAEKVRKNFEGEEIYDSL